MSTRHRTLVLASFAVSICFAWPQAARGSGSASPSPSPSPSGAACEELKARCAQMSDADFLIQGLLDPNGPPPSVGTCYYHTKETCPKCFCDNYLKTSYGEDQKGYDGGTGCIFEPDPLGKLRLVQEMRRICMEGACCCPDVEPYPGCPFVGKAYARDGLTGSCCEFPDACSIPSYWRQQAEPCS